MCSSQSNNPVCKSLFAAIFSLIALLACAAIASAQEPQSPQLAALKLIPWPKSVEIHDGSMVLKSGGRITVSDPQLLPLAKIFSDEIAQIAGVRFEPVQEPPHAGDIALSYDTNLHDEAYTLTVTDQAAIVGADYNAVATGTVTLLQAINISGHQASLPQLTINDGPGLKFDGDMIDIARKPYSIATLKQIADLARFYKIRFLQLHMNDENAWTFPSTAFPKLGRGNSAWAGGAAPPRYTIAELKDLVAYADARGVTFVPEMETIGHSGQLRGTYPEIWGYKTADGKIEGASISNIASEEAFNAFDTLIGEFADVFKSSPYMHIGCDEYSADGIDKYPAVKELMAKEHFTNVGQVCVNYINRMDAICKKHDKRMIVWEGAAYDSTTPKDVIWMDWRGAIANDLIRQGLAVINAPWGADPYFDPYNVNGSIVKPGEPLLLGAIATSWQMDETQALNFMNNTAPLRGEPTWNPNAHKGLTDFLRRQYMLEPTLDKYLDGFTFKMQGALDPASFNSLDPMFTGKLILTPDSPLPGGHIHYTLDKSIPTAESPVFDRPLTLTSSAWINARWISNDGKTPLNPFARRYSHLDTVKDDAIGAKVTLTAGFGRATPQSLVDGYLAAGYDYNDPGWVAWGSRGVKDITLELKSPTSVHNIRGHFDAAGFGLVPPKTVEFFVSNDGKNYRSVGKVDLLTAFKLRGWYSVELTEPVSAKFVRLSADPGDSDWTYVDEVMVNGNLPSPNFIHAALNKPVTVVTQPAYKSPGVPALTAGYINTVTPEYQTYGWLGFGENVVIDATIDMGSPTTLKTVGGHFIQDVGAGVYVPGKIEVLVSNDNKTFQSLGTVMHNQQNVAEYTAFLQVDCKNVQARYVKLKAWGNGDWLFIDQIYVNPVEDPLQTK